MISTRVKNLLAQEKQYFKDYLQEKISKRIEPIIVEHYPENDQYTIHARVEKFNKHNAYSFELTIKVPHGEFLASEVKHNINEVMDIVVDKMETQINKHFKKLVRE